MKTAQVRVDEGKVSIRVPDDLSDSRIDAMSFSYLGRNYRLKLLKGRLQVTLPTASKSTEKIKDALTGWYRTHAEAKIQGKAARYVPLIGVTSVSVGIKTIKSRWGSCHLSGDILYNWKIAIAPNRIVDYVVVHELCYLKQHDHSEKLWKLVVLVIPGYAECEEWLRVNVRSLDI